MTEAPLRRHVFVSSGTRAFGHRVCTCGSLEGASLHRVPEIPVEQQKYEARRVGEAADDD